MVFDGLNSTSKKENYLYKNFIKEKGSAIISYAILGMAKIKMDPTVRTWNRFKTKTVIFGISAANKNKVNIRKLSLEFERLSTKNMEKDPYRNH